MQATQLLHTANIHAKMQTLPKCKIDSSKALVTHKSSAFKRIEGEETRCFKFLFRCTNKQSAEQASK